MSEYQNLVQSNLFKTATIVDKMEMLKDLKHYSLESGCDANHDFYTLFETLKSEYKKLQHHLEIQTKRVENLKEYVKLHLPPIFDSECEGCRCAEIASVKGLRIDQELEKQLEEVK